MSGLDPSGPAQPNLDDAYKTKGNPATKASDELNQAAQNRQAAQATTATDQRIPQTQSSDISQATASSLGYGVRGAPPGEEAKGLTNEDVGRNQELDAEQMAAPGEGKVQKAVAGGHTGSGGTEPGLETDLERKKEEQKEAREAMKAERAGGGGVPGEQRGTAGDMV